MPDPMGPNKSDWSSALDKLADTVRGVTDYFAGRKRILERAAANAEASIIAAKADIEIAEMRRVAADHSRSLEERRNANSAAIIFEAAKALPPPNEVPSKEPVTDDFILTFFAAAQNVSDAQMQALWGRLLAGEVIRPGTFHPATVASLSRMSKANAETFAAICRRGVQIGDNFAPILDLRATSTLPTDLTFDDMLELESMGLFRMEIGEFATHFAVSELPRDRVVTYCGTRIFVTLPQGTSELDIGSLLLTRVGSELGRLASIEPLEGHMDFVVGRWRREGIDASFNDPSTTQSDGPDDQAVA